MNRDDVKKRLLNAYDYLYETGKVHSVTELADKMKRSRPSVSRALNGVPEYLNDKFLKSFTDTFDMISLNWLLTGNGDMFSRLTPNGVIDKQNTIDQSSLVNAALAAKDEIIASKQEIIDQLNHRLLEKDELITELRSRISELQRLSSFAQPSDPLRKYPFEIGVAESDERPRL